jgi:hypothetical protein
VQAPDRSRSSGFAASLRERVAAVAPLAAVRYTAGAGILRLIAQDAILKEPAYREILSATCREILRDGMGGTVASIEILNAQEQQGYIYRAVWKCADIANAAPERLKLLVLADTRVYRPRR